MSLMCSERHFIESIIDFSDSTLRPMSWKAHESPGLWHFQRVLAQVPVQAIQNMSI